MSKSAHLVTGAAAAKLAKDVNASFGPEKAQMVVSGSVYMSVFFFVFHILIARLHSLPPPFRFFPFAPPSRSHVKH